MLRNIHRHYIIVSKRFIVTSTAVFRSKSKKKKETFAFPPRYQKRINDWPQLVQLEIDECQQNSEVLLSNLVFQSYAIDPMKGHIIELRYRDDFLSSMAKPFRCATPVTLVEKFDRTYKYECVVLNDTCDGLTLKLRGAYGYKFDPVTAEKAEYSIESSENFGNMHVVKEFLNQRNRWDRLAGYPIFQTVYRAKPMKSVYVDRKLKCFQSLNKQQTAAVNAALNSQRPIVCIKGPPGTGKTHVLTEIILQANRAKQSVLVCAPSHQAIDNLMKRVEKHIEGIYRASKNPNNFSENTLDSAMQSHNDFDLLVQVYDDLTKAKQLSQDKNVLQSLTRRADALRKKIRTAVVGSSNIIFTTLSSMSVRTLRVFGFQPDLVILEEAAQAMECSSWMALLQAPRAVLAGDPCQLGPVVHSVEATKRGMKTSLMEFVSNEFSSIATISLNEQYRTNESIQKWSSETFYNSDLKPVNAVKNICLSDLNDNFESDVFGPLVMVDTDLKDDDSNTLEKTFIKSFRNAFEAKIICAHYRQLTQLGLPSESIGIITPYSGQVQLLKQRIGDTENVAINSVDAFQGEQREAILISLVRHNRQNVIGFLSDLRRMNVSVTRAKRHLFLVCNGRMLQSVPELKKLYHTFNDYGKILSPSDYIRFSKECKNNDQRKFIHSN